MKLFVAIADLLRLQTTYMRCEFRMLFRRLKCTPVGALRVSVLQGSRIKYTAREEGVVEQHNGGMRCYRVTPTLDGRKCSTAHNITT